MTTRRRRAGSESFVEELPVSAPAATQSGFQGQAQANYAQSSYSLLPQVVNAVNGSLQWGSPSTAYVSPDQAYYKKTDSFSPPHIVPGAVAPSNQPWQPAVPLWNPQQSSNAGYATQNRLNSESGGTYGTYNNQWISSEVDNLTNKQWNSSRIGSSGAQWNKHSASEWSTGLSQLPNIEDSDMASRDRTQEFARIVRSQQGSQTNGILPHQDGKRPRDLSRYKDFMQRSNHDHEVQELTGIIRHDLASLTKQLTDLRNQSRVASPNGTSAHLQKHSSNLVGSLQTKVAFITQKFKDVLEVRTENLKKQAERRDHFTGGAVSGELPPGAVAGHHQGSVLLADEAAAYTGGTEPSRSNGEVAINLGNGGAYHQQLQLMEEQDTYLQSRADTMRTIESTIVELGQMFTQLATMVKEQEELVHRYVCGTFQRSTKLTFLLQFL
ncbi:Syntaxin-5 [Halocaridina rubra]|uniref:Syntaxin-5 n=1 Tax=Halocaridina rubra TaxID=373956 RepID=A0AAN9AEY1_HALRR